jgi:PAS domain S-box-containing protein
MKARTRASLELLFSISRELATHLDLNALLGRILQLTIETIGADSGSILVLDEEGEVTEGSIYYQGHVHGQTASQLTDTLDQGLAGWVARKRSAVLVPSTRDDPRWLRRLREEAKEMTKSAISVPLLARNRVVGVLTLVHPEEGHFSEDDLDLLNSIADQAGIAVENARLFAAEQERRRFASTLQEIARSISSSLDPSLVFPQVLEQLKRVVRYDSASIFVLEDDELRLVAARGFVDNDAMLDLSIPIEEGQLINQVISTQEPIVVEDVQSSPGAVMQGNYPAMDRIRGWIGAPLLLRDRAVGVLTLNSHHPGTYREPEVEVVSAFAHQAATAVANARLYAESKRQMEAMVALAESARVVTASLDLDEVLQRILSQTIQTLGVEAASLALVERSSGVLEFKSASGGGAESLIGIRLKPGQGIAGWVVEQGQPVSVPDVQSDPRFYPEVDQKIGFETRALACVPIQVQEEVIGVLEVINPRFEPISPDQLEILMGIAGLAGTAIEHARLFEETKAAQQRYAGLFEDSVDPIITSDLTGQINEANRRAQTFLGRARDTLLGTSMLALLSPQPEGEIPALEDIQPGLSYSYESNAIHQEGMELPIEVYVKRIDIGKQPVLQWILHDISERIELDQLRADLTSMIFHDLRSPLGNVISSLEVMEATLQEDEGGLGPVLSVAQRSSRRLSRLIDSLLDIDNLEEGEQVLQKTPTSIAVLLKEAVEEIRPVAEAKGHEILSVPMDSELPDVVCDEDMIRRVIINLLENAVKFTPSGGQISLAVLEGEDHIQVSVEDNGPGIAAKDKKRIFDKFARVSRKEGRAKGLGLGLAFCRLVVEAHGGEIWVDSEPNQGATFHFRLPL